MIPFLEMKMVYADRKSFLTFYTAGSPVSTPTSPSPYSHYYVNYNDKDFMIGQYNVMKGAFRSYDYFFGQ
jgi:hypothetical protein